jgi:hypothetical protein
VSTGLVHVDIEAIVGVVSRAEAEDLSENEIVKLLSENSLEFVHADLVEVLGTLAVLVDDIGKKVLDVGAVHGVGVALACDLDHEFEVTLSHEELEAALVLNQVLEDGAGVQGLLKVGSVLLRHLHEESLGNHNFLGIENVVHLVESSLVLGGVSGATLGAGGSRLLGLIRATVIPVDETSAGSADTGSITCVVLNEELHGEEGEHEGGEGIVLHVAEQVVEDFTLLDE